MLQVSYLLFEFTEHLWPAGPLHRPVIFSIRTHQKKDPFHSKISSKKLRRDHQLPQLRKD